VEVAEKTISAAGLSGVEVVTGDAALVDNYQDFAPADLLMICGLFVHITRDDAKNLIEASTSLVKQGGTVIWTQGRLDPDPVPLLEGWFLESGFERIWLSDASAGMATVGVHRNCRVPAPLVSGTSLFTFVGKNILEPIGWVTK
jgi:hypothetical protein